jgi:DNA-binding NarL/FixJ family response regulator
MNANGHDGGARDDVRVLVVDDQPHFLLVAEEVIRATPGFQAVGSARSAKAALEWLRASKADLVVMDVRMPGTDGVDAARQVGTLDDPPVVVLCSSDDRPDITADPRAHGADAFYRKERFGARLLREAWAAFGRPRPA